MGPRRSDPPASAWKPGPVALGVVALYLFVAVEVSSLAMRRLPRRWWRRIHLASFGAFWLATLHGLLAGTDRTNPLLFGAYATAGGLVVFLTLLRILTARPAAARRAATAGSHVGGGLDRGRLIRGHQLGR
jgi:DMSO/TMAO reductase YedYZ heme-binding membrane subunit